MPVPPSHDSTVRACADYAYREQLCQRHDSIVASPRMQRQHTNCESPRNSQDGEVRRALPNTQKRFGTGTIVIPMPPDFDRRGSRSGREKESDARRFKTSRTILSKSPDTEAGRHRAAWPRVVLSGRNRHVALLAREQGLL